MRRPPSAALAALAFSSAVILPAATRIDDPKNFVTEVYRRIVSAQSSSASSYSPPDDIYTPRLSKLFRDDRRKAHDGVGCLDFDFWTNAQDWMITELTVSSVDEGQERKTMVAKFRNFGTPREIHFVFRRAAGRWLLDDVNSVLAPRWTLSEILKCSLK